MKRKREVIHIEVGAIGYDTGVLGYVFLCKEMVGTKPLSFTVICWSSQCQRDMDPISLSLNYIIITHIFPKITFVLVSSPTVSKVFHFYLLKLMCY